MGVINLICGILRSGFLSFCQGNSWQRMSFHYGYFSYENPKGSEVLSEILNAKGVPNDLELWGFDVPHDWPTWRKMLPYVIETKF